MTREEAIKKAEECFQFNVPGQVGSFAPFRLVAALENLGILKLEEPKSARERFIEEMSRRRLYGSWFTTSLEAFDASHKDN